MNPSEVGKSLVFICKWIKLEKDSEHDLKAAELSEPSRMSRRRDPVENARVKLLSSSPLL